jgi:S1-C subfamily serine protease
MARALPRFLVALVLLALGFSLGHCRAQRRVPPAEVTPSAPVAEPPAAPASGPVPGDLAADERATIELFRRASPAVVYITSLAERRDFFSMNVLQVPAGTGTGFVWDRQGHVVTNYHVIAQADAAEVTLADHSSWPARLVGAAPEKDLAVLAIEAPPERLSPLPVGRSENLQVGQKVFAIGNPFGLDQTLTTGIISALGREIDSLAGVPIRDVVQTDAAINPGNSGGPLLDSQGLLIGVNTAIYSPSGAYAGIGFAIPVDTVSWVVPDLLDDGKVSRPSLGVELASAALARRLGVEGALVLSVVRGSGADRAGLRGTGRDMLGRVRLGDVIVGVDEQPVRSAADLLLALERRRPGERVRVRFERGGDAQEVEAALQ